ncbi:hypothetical protein [Rhodopila sp.]|uniref:hypothetical protein n=1 Tax=Rhodopila sp. TaxID=2480087 RepID=UPI003D0B8F92
MRTGELQAAGAPVTEKDIPSITQTSRRSAAAGHVSRADRRGLCDRVLRFVLYGVFGTILGRQFFPSSDPILELQGAAGAFAAGFLMRPIGGIVAGRIADRAERKSALVVNMMLMGLDGKDVDG